MRLLRVTPVEYYSLREDENYPSLSEELEDEFGVDRRINIKPYVKTFLPSHKIVQYEELILKHISNGEKLIKIAEEMESSNVKTKQDRLIKSWERISGLKQCFKS